MIINGVRVTERGWAGHFIASDRCKFRRNTLLEYGDKKWIVSTVGNYYPRILLGDEYEKMTEIGVYRYYETMAFEGALSGEYIDADVSHQIYFDSPWGLFADSREEFHKKYPFADNNANDMHEKVVEELIKKIKE